ncbi:leucine-rich repeat domain-containing protein [Butyrivibrio sp. WCD2001]|uniref:leucine-rich repeat domain-containing protein n=1 Tax=Butyrivibrio sp. WCD2001 TaxID=1280681 RepID=UPI0003F829A7|nr:leucine-rich repeat domain-containing protein [Butyrivibrio sp. WCD2001]
MKKCLLTAAAVVLSAAAFISRPIKADAMANARTWNTYAVETGYYYEQLDPKLKEYYRVRGQIIAETGNGWPFAYQIDEKMGITDEQYGISNEDCNISRNAYEMDHPALFSRVNSNNTAMIVDADAVNATLNQAAGIAASVAGCEDNEKVRVLHDHLVNNCSYVSNATNKQVAYGALVEGGAVCEGYARAFALLCHMSNVECVLQYGRSMGMDHAWNLVKLQDGEWYEVDATWDDNGDGYPPAYDNFLKTYQQMENHYHVHYNGSATDVTAYYRGLIPPVANGTKYALSSSATETTAAEGGVAADDDSMEQQNNAVSEGGPESAQGNTANSTNVPSQNTAAKSVVNPTAVSDFYSGEHVAVSGETIVVNGTEAAIVKGSGNSIPSYVAVGEYRYEVTEISDGAYSNNSSLKSVTIPKNVRKIGAKAFYNCRNLKKIKFAGKKVNKIGTKAFGNIGKRATASIPKKVYDKYVKLLKKSKPVKGIKYKKR